MRVQLTRALLAALVGAGLVLPAGAAADGRFRLALDTLVYDDTDSVFIVSPQAAVHYDLDSEGSGITARTVVDTISAASVDVVSHATNRFSEIRTEADLSVAHIFGEHLPSLGYRISSEPDYLSHGFRAGWQSRLGTSDSVLSLGYGLTLDTVGRSGTPFDTFSESLTTHSVTASYTQVLGERTVMRGVYTLTRQDGYMEKPYRHVPLFVQADLDAANAAGVELDLGSFDAYRLAARPHEEVPDARTGHAAGLRLLQYVDGLGSVRLDYQLYVDSWEVVAHTVEPAILVEVGEHLVLGAHMRLYRQSGAFFWRREYVVSQPDRVPRFRTIDRGLSPSTALSGGVRVELSLEPFQAYAEMTAMYTSFDDYLFLDDRLALVSQVGVRWHP